jgi:hypothetical protein
MSAYPTCPYCNASLSAGSRASSGRGIICPRCQEVIPERVTHAPDGSASRSFEHEQLASPRQSNLRVASYFLGLMLVMAGVGLGFAWYSQSMRRSRDHLQRQTDPSTLHVTVTAPSDLEGVGYLPADVDLVLGLHSAEMTESESGRQLLQVFRARTEFPGAVGIESIAGMKLEDMDHLVLGLRVQERALPRVTLVIRTRVPYNLQAIANTLKGSRADHGSRKLYRFALGGAGIEATLWPADDRTLVVTWLPQDLDVVPEKPALGLDRFSDDLRQVFRENLHPGMFCWLAGAMKNAEPAFAPLVFLGMPEKDVKTLAAMEKLAVWLRANGEVQIRIVADARDSASTDRIVAYLTRWGIVSGKSVPALVENPRTQPLAAELAQKLQIIQNENRFTIDASCKTQALVQAVEP